MGGLQNKVASVFSYEWFLLLCKTSPEQEHQSRTLLRKSCDGGIRKAFPAMSLMGSGLLFAHGERGIEQQCPVVRPLTKVTRAWDGSSKVVLHFLEDVLERGRVSHPIIHREAKPVGLTLAVIGVLT